MHQQIHCLLNIIIYTYKLLFLKHIIYFYHFLAHRVQDTVVVNVLDANDHAPVYTNTKPYVVEVGELKPVTSVLIQLFATDADKGINKEVLLHCVVVLPYLRA